jgi:hypothetical protein
MTLTRLLAAALLASSALAFAQTKTDSLAVADQAAPSKPATTASSEAWKFIPNQLADASAGKDPLNRLQIDKYKVFRSNTNTRTLLVSPEADAGMILSDLGGELDGVTTCLKIRSYLVARDSKDSDSTHPVSYSTCQPAKRFSLRTTDMRSGSLDR